MLKLMKLEIKKFKLGFNRAIITNLIMLAILLFTDIISKIEKDAMFDNYNMMFLIIGLLVRAVFLISAGMMISRIIIDEYKNKTINVLFLYPINRKQIMLSKLLIIVLYTFTTMTLSTIFLDCSMIVANNFTHFINETLTMEMVIKNLLNILVYSLAFSLISLIPMAVGMKKKSSSATNVTAIILVSLLTSGSGDFNLSSIIIIPIILGIVGAGVSYLSIKNVDKVDVENY